MTIETNVKIVVDASVIGTIFFREPGAELLEQKLIHKTWVAPVLVDYEIGSVYLKKIRVYPHLRKQLDDCYQIYCGSSIQRVDVPVHAVVSVAEKYGLTIYDASYFWLAATLNLDLITLDKQLDLAWSKR